MTTQEHTLYPAGSAPERNGLYQKKERVRASRANKIAEIERHRWSLLIGGELRDAQHEQRYEVIDPYTLEVLASVPDASPADIDAAVEAADTALAAWRKIPVLERAKFVYQFADTVERHKEELAFLETLDTGSPISMTRNDVDLAVRQIRMFASFALQLKGQTIPASSGLHYTVREPEGIVAKIYAFNHPLMFGCRLSAPLVAGNTVVSKPPEVAPLSMLRLGELIQEVFPPGVVNIVVGHGSEVPDRIVRHPKVRRIGFIGSEPTGRAIQKAAAESGVKHVTLELGGKNAMVVFDDADISKAAEGAIRGMNLTWSGQSCGSNSRVLVHAGIAEKLTQAIAERLRSRRIGNPLEEETEQGTMIDVHQFEKSMEYIEIAKHEGARVVVGGGKPEGPGLETGYFVEATVLTDVEPNHRIANEEVFGPLMSIITFETEEEAIRIANGVQYGLTASVWTKDLERALRVVDAFEAGYVWVNHSGTHFPGVPYGGVKASGVGGKEESLEELLSYTEEKVVNVVY